MSTDSEQRNFNPGSDAARDHGCVCPGLDNNRGTYPPRPPDGWWIVPSCRLHGVDSFGS